MDFDFVVAGLPAARSEAVHDDCATISLRKRGSGRTLLGTKMPFDRKVSLSDLSVIVDGDSIKRKQI